jgi:hypothetical protein
MLLAAGFGRVGEKVHPTIFLLDWGKRRLPSESEVQRQFAIHLPVILEVAGEVGPLLADEPDRVDAPVIYPSEQEGCEWIPGAYREVGVARETSRLRCERCTSRDALPAEAVVMVSLIHSAKLIGVLAPDPGHIIVERIDGIFRAIIGRPAPSRVPFAEGEPKQVFIAIRHAGKADFVLPADSAFHGRLRWIVILTPVVSARVEVVEKSGRERMIPTHAEHLAVPLGVVVIRVKARQNSLSTLNARDYDVRLIPA